MTESPVATKADLEQLYHRTEAMLGRVVGNVVGEIVGDALQVISERFDRVDKRFDRLEDKLDTTIARVDHHAIDIRELQRKSA